jgi:hypothetical protein
MDDELYEDLMQSPNEALAYERGDITKGRSVIVSIPDEEIELNQAKTKRGHQRGAVRETR